MVAFVSSLAGRVNFDPKTVRQSGAATGNFGCLLKISRINQEITYDRLMLLAPRLIRRRSERLGNRLASPSDWAAKTQFSLRLQLVVPLKPPAEQGPDFCGRDRFLVVNRGVSKYQQESASSQ